MTRIHTTALALIGLALPALSPTAHAQITGFGNGSGFTRTGFDSDSNGVVTNPSDPPTISGGVLTLTTNAPAEARAAFANAAQPIGAFVVSFTYQAVTSSSAPFGPADGFTFTLQNDARGPAALGNNAAGLGYGDKRNNGPQVMPISPSASVQFNLFSSPGTAYETGGVVADDPFPATGAVNLASGDPIQVRLTYDGTTLTETLTDAAPTIPAVFTTTYTTDIPAAVGGGTAFVGFTGGTGGSFSTQTISGFTFAAAPEPSQFAALGIGLLGLAGLTLRARRRAA